MKIDLTEGTLNGGNYINYDDTGTETVFKVAEDGATTIKGEASGTDALILTTGDILVTQGHIDMTVGDLTLADGSVSITDEDNAASLTVTNNTASTYSGGVATITANGLTTGSALLVTSSGTITNSSQGLVNIVGSGITSRCIEDWSYWRYFKWR